MSHGAGVTVDFFCVGVAKAGTTSLHDLLDLQHAIRLPDRKETNYFSFGMAGKPRFCGPLDDSSVNEPTITSIEQYAGDFPQGAPGAVYGEVCPSYALPGTAGKIHAHNPDAKIIILLREPVSRAFSNYQHLVRDGREHLSFEAALSAEEQRLAEGWEWFWGLKRNSRYFDTVNEYLDTFGAERVKIILFEDFVKDQRQHLASVMEFIGLDTSTLVYETFDSNKSGVVSRRWMTAHRLLLSEGSFNSFLRTLLPAPLRKRLGQLLKSVSTEKGELSKQTRDELSRDFASDLARLDALVGGKVGTWPGARDVS